MNRGRGFLNNYFLQKTKEIENAISEKITSQILDTELNILIDIYVSHHAVQLLILDWAGHYTEKTKTSLSPQMLSSYVDITHIGIIPQQPTYIRYSVPFSGDASLLNYIPSRSNHASLPPFIHRDNILSFEVVYRSNYPDETANMIETYKSWFKDQFDYINIDIANYNAQLRNILSQILKTKKNELQKEVDFFAKLNIPLKKDVDKPIDHIAMTSKTRNKKFHSVAISYGGPDVQFARDLKIHLMQHGVEPFFFEDDAVPGHSLSNTMDYLASKFDKVILLCSKSSLSRPGVLNELENVIARETSEGHRSILIPIALDEYVFLEWKPENEVLAKRIRERVIGRLFAKNLQSAECQKQLSKILQALTRIHKIEVL